jgi:type I restriction enzyme S subunit
MSKQIREGYKQTKVGIIPEDWEVVKVENLGALIGGGTPSTKNEDFWNGTIPWISSSDLDENSIYNISVSRFINENAIKNSATKLIPKNSILIVSRVGVGKIAINDQLLCTSQDFQSLVLNRDNHHFIAYEIKNEIQKLITYNQGTSIKGFVKNDLLGLQIPLPPLEEQEKIAEVLTTWDDAIELQENLIGEKESLKKGLMQKLLGGEVRFREFTDKWKETKLGEVIKLQGGYAFKNKEFKKSGIPIVRISNISNTSNYMEMNDLVYYNELSNDNNFIIKKNDLLIAMSGATTGKVSIYNLEQKAYLNQRVGLFKSLKPSLIDYGFLIQFVFSNIFSSQLTSLLVAGAQPNISSKDIESLKIKLPSLQEQQKIAEVLSLADNEIELLKNELDELKLQKKGLMQKLLTGKVRVEI